MQCEVQGIDVHAEGLDKENMGDLSLADRALLSELQKLIDDATKGLEKYRLSDVGERLYSFTWDFFCDWYVELSKESFRAPVCLHAFRTLLHLLHPYIPFVTEELWNHVKPKANAMLMIQGWPKAIESFRDRRISEQFQILIDVITSLRSIRTEYAIEARKEIDAVLITKGATMVLEEQAAAIRRLARIKSLTVQNEPYKGEGAASAFTKHVEIHVPLEGIIDIAKEKERLTKEKEQLERFLKGIEGKLANKEFVKNAPQEVVLTERQKAAEARAKLQKIDEKLAVL